MHLPVLWKARNTSWPPFGNNRLSTQTCWTEGLHSWTEWLSLDVKKLEFLPSYCLSRCSSPGVGCLFNPLSFLSGDPVTALPSYTEIPLTPATSSSFHSNSNSVSSVFFGRRQRYKNDKHDRV